MPRIALCMASGAVAVQAVREHRGQRAILGHVGAAGADGQLGILLECARQIAAEDQGVLDIGVAVRAHSVDIVDGTVVRDLVIARIGEPTGMANAVRALTDLGVETVSCRTIQRHLAKSTTGN